MKLLNKVLGLAILACAVLPASAQFTKTTPTLAALKLVQPDPNYPFVMVLGWATVGDGGGGLYQIATQAASTNYGIVTSTVDSARQWVRMPGLIGFGKPPRTQTLTATNMITIESDTVAVTGTSGATVLTNNQTLASGVDGQLLTVIGSSDTDTVQIVDKSNLAAGGTIQMSATNVVLGIGDVIVFKYNLATTNWHEVSRSNN